MLLSKSFLVLLLATLVVTQEITRTGHLRGEWEVVRTRLRNLRRDIRRKVVDFTNHIRQHVKNIRAIIEEKIEAKTRNVTDFTEELSMNASALGVDIHDCLSIQDDLKEDLQEGPHRCVEDKILSAKNVSRTLKALLHDASEMLEDAVEGLERCSWRPICAAKVIAKASIRSLSLVGRFSRVSLGAIKFAVAFLTSTNNCVDKELTDAPSKVSSAMDDISSCADKEMDIFH